MEKKVDISWNELEAVRQIVQFSASAIEYANGDTPIARDLHKASGMLCRALYGKD